MRIVPSKIVKIPAIPRDLPNERKEQSKRDSHPPVQLLISMILSSGPKQTNVSISQLQNISPATEINFVITNAVLSAMMVLIIMGGILCTSSRITYRAVIFYWKLSSHDFLNICEFPVSYRLYDKWD